MRVAVFLDRDGTIAEEMGYLNDLARFRMFPFAPAAIRRLNQAEMPVIVVTNQSGVARGFFPESLVHQVHERMQRELAAGDARVEGIYFCPHGKEHDCDCRKPRPGMLDRAAIEHGLTLEGSFVVSDRHDDVLMGQSIGCHGILVRTGYGAGEYEWNRTKWDLQPDYVAEDLADAVEHILAQANAKPAKFKELA
ncbi:MAG: HAD family hydrolase [Acidobacteria bacterium]|nr:HAD family hydrolase [Acidobacteriota bacterium]